MSAGVKSMFAFWMGGGGLVQAGFKGMLGFWFGGGGVSTTTGVTANKVMFIPFRPHYLKRPM